MSTSSGVKSRDILEHMTMREIKQVARDMGISLGYSSATKKASIDEIMTYLDARSDEEEKEGDNFVR